MSAKKIIIAGGTGFLGDLLAEYFTPPVYEVVILTRNPKLYSHHSRHVKWDGKNPGPWITELESAYAVINLTGRTVDCRYNEKNKKEILESRVKATRAVGNAIQQCIHPPQIWINAASATIYRHATDREMNDISGEFGSGFSVSVCKAWEQAFNEMDTPQTRKVVLRLAMVLANHRNSVLPVLKRLVKFGLGGKMGDGKQFISWIHATDFLHAIELVMSDEKIAGTYNLSARSQFPMQHL